MTRWNWKRWAFAFVTGSALTSAFAAADDPKTGESITLKYTGQPDRVVTVIRSVRKTDGSLETQVKDAKTGVVFTLTDPAPEKKSPVATDSKPAGVLPTVPKPVNSAPQPLPLPKPAVNSAPQPLPSLPKPPVMVESKAPTAPGNQVVEAGDKRILGGGKLFSREPQGGPATIPHTPAAAAATPFVPAVDEKRPGIMGRVFGKKPVPSPITNAPAMPVPAPVQPVAPPVAAGPTTVPMPLPTPVRTNQEPPRVQPVKPAAPPVAPGRVEKVVPPTPVIPSVSAPLAPNTVPTPPPPPAKPTIPPVVSPAIPTLPAAPLRLPTIPAAPMSKTPVAPAMAMKPANTPEPVKPVVHSPVKSQLPAEVESRAKVLKETLAPSARLKAAKELATGPHASTQAVHTVLFRAAKLDLCPEVKADCIDHLSNLGYRDPAFVAYVKSACSDESSEVRLAAKTALAKMK